MANANHIVVAGAGIIGASIAWHLTSRGAQVTIIERKSAGAEASGKSFGWLNASQGKRPYQYHKLSRLGLEAWRETAGQLPLPVSWGGALSWAHEPLGRKRQAQDSALQRHWDAPVVELGASGIRRLQRGLVMRDDSQGSFSELDGWVDAAVATQVLLDAAQTSGAKFIGQCELLDSIITEQRLTGVVTSNGSIDATHLVLACGANADSFARAGRLVIPQKPTGGVIVTTDALPPILTHLLIANGTHVYQRMDGRLVIGEAQPMPAAARGAVSDAQAAQAGARLLAKVSEFLPSAAAARVATTTLGWRPMPVDGYPAIGRSPGHPDIYAAVTHSGVTLAIILGQLIAREVLDTTRVEMLAPYRPERF